VTSEELVGRSADAAHRTAGRLADAQAAARNTFRHPGEHETLLGRLLGWIADQARRLLPDVSIGGGPTAAVGWLLLAALVATVAALVVRGLLAARRPSVSLPRRSGPDAASARPFDVAREEALRLAASDPREALRLLYAAILGEVGRRRGWRAVPGLTNWSYVRRLGTASAQGAALGECTRLFERHVYGDEPASAQDVAKVDVLAGTVLT
jgi:hypothetical protein